MPIKWEITLWILYSVTKMLKVNLFPWLSFLEIFALYNFFCPILLCLVFSTRLSLGTSNDLNLAKMKEPIGMWVLTEYQAQLQSNENRGLYINDKARHKHEVLILFNYLTNPCVLRDGWDRGLSSWFFRPLLRIRKTFFSKLFFSSTIKNVNTNLRKEQKSCHREIHDELLN